MDFFERMFGRKTCKPFEPPPIEPERTYVPVEDLLPEKHLPPGLPSKLPDDWNIDVPYPRLSKVDLLNRLGKTKMPKHVLDKYLDEQKRAWLVLELQRKRRLFERGLTEANTRLVEAQAQDEQDRVSAREFNPQPEVVQYPAGVFIRYAEHEYPQKYIESIAITQPGHAPFLSTEEPRVHCHGLSDKVEDGYVHVIMGKAHIAVTLGSGHSFWYTTNRWQVDKLLDALTHAWKHGVP